MATIAFFGLGQMGAPMSANLIKGGHTLHVFDLDKNAVKRASDAGAKAFATPSEAAKGCDFVISMLPEGEHVREVLLGVNGATKTLAKSALIIDMSTIHPQHSDQIRKDLAKDGFEMIDVPVGRTSDQAITGQLLLLAGGTNAQIERARPILMLMGNELVDAGGAGMGIRVKMVNNYMSIALNALSAEAAVLCEALGLDFETALTVMKGTPANKGHFTTTWANKVLKGDLSPAFMVNHAHKDIGLALDVANRLHATLPMGAAARETYNQARAAGRGAQDWTAVLESLRVASGMKAKI